MDPNGLSRLAATFRDGQLWFRRPGVLEKGNLSLFPKVCTGARPKTVSTLTRSTHGHQISRPTLV